MPRLALSLLGPFQARVGERAVVHFATDKARALLAYLAVEADRPHRRDTLAALLWPEWDDFLLLARTAAADLLPSALATALGVNLSSAAEPADQLAAYLRPRTALLVLDNMEHLLDGAAFLVQWLEAAPGLKLLVTSREALNVRGEERFMLGGLDDIAVAQLFISAAARLRPGYDPDATERAAIAAIGRAVGGMPLAVELAATWVRLMDAPAIADQVRHNLDFLTSTLRDLPPRQRSMRAIFDQAWATLSPLRHGRWRRCRSCAARSGSPPRPSARRRPLSWPKHSRKCVAPQCVGPDAARGAVGVGLVAVDDGDAGRAGQSRRQLSSPLQVGRQTTQRYWRPARMSSISIRCSPSQR